MEGKSQERSYDLALLSLCRGGWGKPGDGVAFFASLYPTGGLPSGEVKFVPEDFVWQ